MKVALTDFPNLTLLQCEQRTFTVGRRIAVQLSSLTRLDLTNKDNMFFFVGSEAVESKLVKLETRHSKILPPTV